MIRSHINKGALVALALSVSVSMSLTGCEALGLSDGQPAQNSPPPKKASKKAPKKEADAKAKEKAADSKEYERPVYPENVRRNPFQPEKEIIEPTVTENSDEVRPLEPLEQFDINRLSLVAIISSVVVPKAMFVDPNGVGHIVKERDRIGSQGAVIIDIRENEVDIQESSGEEGAGSRVRTIKLATDELKASSEGELSQEEREALERLLGSEQGRKQLRDRLGGSEAPPVNREGGGIAPPKP
jgi:Tfp pilus assembly protein PilP